jgi:tetratricopeptide (TPR) repeat protein
VEGLAAVALETNMAKAPRSGGVKRVEGESDLTPDVMQALLSQLGASRNSEEVDAAQDIMFDAWECDDRRKRTSLALKALKVSPSCADAYTRRPSTPVSGRWARPPSRKMSGCSGASSKPGPICARQGLASALLEVGRRDEAVARLDDMMRLNPNDNQGLRYVLIDWLQQLGRDDEAARLFKRYKGDDVAAWLWPAALAAFRKSGDGTASRTALRRALARTATSGIT